VQPTFERTVTSAAGDLIERGRRIHVLTAALRQDCRDWRVAPVIAAALFFFPLVVAIIVAVALVDRDSYDLLVNEDGILEWIELAGFVSASLLAFALARQFRGDGELVVAALYVLFAVGCFFIAGEEISWGQRILGVGTPDELARVNSQAETNVHNISVLRVMFHVGYALLGFGGSVLAVVLRLRYWSSLGARLRRLVPPLFLVSSFLVLFIYRLVRIAFDSYDRSAVGRYGEVTEFALAFGLFAFAGLQVRRVVLERKALATQDPDSSADGWSGCTAPRLPRL
jgi:hypothetical protein